MGTKTFYVVVFTRCIHSFATRLKKIHRNQSFFKFIDVMPIKAHSETAQAHSEVSSTEIKKDAKKKDGTTKDKSSKKSEGSLYRFERAAARLFFGTDNTSKLCPKSQSQKVSDN